MPDGMKALPRRVVGVVGPLAGLLGPADQCRAEAVADFLLLFVEHLMGKLLPGEPQVAGHGDHPQADRPARREHRIDASRVEPECLDLAVREIARGDHVGYGHCREPSRPPRFRQMHVEKGPMTAGQLAEGMQRLHHPRSLRPAAADARRHRHHGRLAPPQGIEPALPARLVAGLFVGEGDVFIVHVLDRGGGGETVLRQADPTGP